MQENPLNQFKTVCMMGLGYIGLPTATLIASRGPDVIGVDKNQKVVDTINQGKIHIVEPDLEGLVAKVIADGKLKAQTEPSPADVFMIAVPTPIKEDKSPDIDYVIAASEALAPTLQKGNLVIIESTSPVGTTDIVADLLAKLRPDLTFPQQAGEDSDIRMAYCPERVLPGRIITELMFNDRTIGGMTPLCAQTAQHFYHIFVNGNCYTTEAKAAELVKLTENAYRDVNIAFANELANICAHHDIDEWDVIRLANCHPRVNILSPGPGVGGHCIPIDPWFIVSGAPEQSTLIKRAREINDERPHHIINQVKEAVAGNSGLSVACLGLAYKPDVDDLRESPAIEIAQAIKDDLPNQLYIAEPHIDALPESLTADHVQLCDGLTAVSSADIVVTLVKHRAFTFIDPRALAETVLIDASGLWRK